MTGERKMIWFVGVSTRASAIHRLFPYWADALGVEADLIGVDLPLHSQPSTYESLVQQIVDTCGLAGAVVTSHKVRLLESARDRFTSLSGDAHNLGEVNSIRIDGGELYGDATDVAAIEVTLDSIVDRVHFRKSGAEVVCFGSGGSARALALACLAGSHPDRTPLLMPTQGRPRLHIVGRRTESLEQFSRMLDHAGIGAATVNLHHNADPAGNDELLASLPPGSLAVNATGLGKDSPGSPITPAARFPQGATAWDFNYRGDLVFLSIAAQQRSELRVSVEDGWGYFLQGWHHALGFILDRPVERQTFERVARAAAGVRPPRAWKYSHSQPE
jgi:shikimate dehydrogenase